VENEIVSAVVIASIISSTRCYPPARIDYHTDGESKFSNYKSRMETGQMGE
jgi:hypothetical protein